jgi:hypothetical protein
MDTIYALVVILSGVLVPGDDANENILSGEVENKTTVYYKTLEACELAYSQALASKDQMLVPGMDITVEIKPCEGIQVVQ